LHWYYTETDKPVNVDANYNGDFLSRSVDSNKQRGQFDAKSII